MESPLPFRKIKEPTGMSFVDAIGRVCHGEKICRLEWENSIYCVVRDGFLMINRNGKDHQWVISDGDTSASDWVVI